ncbi:MAG: CidA/LrgA family protein [Clostridiales bacterium]|nr:CidA/LrgA family protein [Clostridiales bacterium]
MKYLKQFAIILVFSFLGEFLNGLIPLPIPGNIYGLVLLFLALLFGIVKPAAIKETAGFLIAVMPFLLLPSAAGLLDSAALLKESWLPYLLLTLGSTAVVMVVSGHVTQLVLRLGKKRGAATEDAAASEAEGGQTK